MKIIFNFDDSKFQNVLTAQIFLPREYLFFKKYVTQNGDRYGKSNRCEMNDFYLTSYALCSIV